MASPEWVYCACAYLYYTIQHVRRLWVCLSQYSVCGESTKVFWQYLIFHRFVKVFCPKSESFPQYGTYLKLWTVMIFDAVIAHRNAQNLQLLMLGTVSMLCFLLKNCHLGLDSTSVARCKFKLHKNRGYTKARNGVDQTNGLISGTDRSEWMWCSLCHDPTPLIACHSTPTVYSCKA